MTKKLNSSGDRIGMLTLLRLVKIKYGTRFWEMKCDCGRIIVSNPSYMRRGKHKSCGCNIKFVMTTHGHSYKRIHKIWGGLFQRCRNKKCRLYKNYGGRGIKLCLRWNKYENFYNDMSHGYADNLQIERIDNSKGYNKDNCRWATRKEQSVNRRTNRFLTINGVRRCITEWAETSGISRSTIMVRLKMGWPAEKCMINKSFKAKYKLKSEK